jgi:AraC-like DNA-binding protein
LPDDTWQYWRAPAGNVVEWGLVRGLHVALPVHFHLEDQITQVLSGKRIFVVRGEIVEVAAGESLTIPAGTPHGSLSDSADVHCINMYVAPRPCEATYVACAGPHRTVTCYARTIHIDPWETVGQAAHRTGVSREGFSRRFKKLQGLAPEDFRLVLRLNDARRLLRAGEPIATVAAEAGFSDQSHLGRCFRRFFGVTPGRYRSGFAASTTKPPVTHVL